MARTEIPLPAYLVNPTTQAVTAAVGASVTVKARNSDGTSGSNSTVYQNATGLTTVTNPLTVDAAGRIEGWLEPGPYNLVISGTGIVTYTQPYDSVPEDDVETAFSMYRPVTSVTWGRYRFDAPTAATYVIPPSGVTGGTGIAASSAGAGLCVFRYDPADFGAGGRTANVRVNGTVHNNATAPTVSYTVAVFPVTAVAGGAPGVSITLGTAVTGSSITFTTPTASTSASTTTSDFTLSAGYYAFGVTPSGNAAASSSTVIAVHLQQHFV